MAPFFMLQTFEKYLTVEKRFSVHTVNAYLNDVMQFSAFLNIEKLEDFKNVNHKSARTWIVSLVDDHLENKSINRKLSSIRTFFKWLKKDGFIETNPLSKIIGPKTKRRLPTFAKVDEISQDKTNELFSEGFET